MVSLDYNDFQFVQTVNVTNHVSDLVPVTKVYGAAASVLDQELFMARYAGPLQPGEV